MTAVVREIVDSSFNFTNSRWRMICERDSSVRRIDIASFSRASLYLVCELGEVEKVLVPEACDVEGILIGTCALAAILCAVPYDDKDISSEDDAVFSMYERRFRGGLGDRLHDCRILLPPLHESISMDPFMESILTSMDANGASSSILVTNWSSNCS